MKNTVLKYGEFKKRTSDRDTFISITLKSKASTDVIVEEEEEEAPLVLVVVVLSTLWVCIVRSSSRKTLKWKKWKKCVSIYQ